MYERLYYQCYEGKIRPSKSKGKRQRLSVKKNCLSRISFAKDGPYLKCISIHDIHNHDRDLSLFMASCRQRQLDGDQKSIIHQALKYDGNLTLIHQEMKRKNLNITKRDLYNLKHQYMKNPCSVNDLEDLIKTIKLDITNIVELFEENGIFKALYYQTKKMQDHYLRYPEVVLIDATYNLNSYHLPVFTLGVIDGEENTRIVAIWLVLSESSTTVKNMCQIFKNYNNVFLKTLTIISDKNFTERAIYQDEFPNAKLEIFLNKEIDNEIDLSIMQDITNQENLQLSKENLELPKENLQLSKKNIELPIQDQLQLPKTLSFHKLHSKLL
ncbi:uncharacterized protein LOC135922387 [Gordionus sp. m RMFG-2023]|uniref:uncharacterized protein LOC135922387 n=1 Tax=Gordionus sp. m RMFG-2023 TaxID=3053472 RepID=UPI0031FD3455